MTASGTRLVSGRSAVDEELARFFMPDADMIADPFGMYARLRELGPAYRFRDRVLVSHYQECRDLLVSATTLQGLSVRGTRYRTALAGLPQEDRDRLAEMFTFYEKRVSGIDGEKHKRLRRLAQRAFTPRVVARMQGRVQAITDSLLDAVRGIDEIEFIEQFAYHLPLIVISEMLDIPVEDRERLRQWASDLGQFVGADWSDTVTLDRTHTSVFQMREYLTGIFDSRRGTQTTELLQALLDAEGDDEDRFTEDELVAMITQFVFAGHETTTNLLGNSAVVLWRDRRDQWDLLRQRPDLIPSAVEELLRFASPTQYVDKLAAEDGEIGGVHVKRWDTLVILIGSGNRDERAYERPGEFDVTRVGKGHLTFGFGPHHCLGASLARMEVAVVLRTLGQRFPDIELAAPDDVRYRPNSMLRGPELLPVRLGRERRG